MDWDYNDTDRQAKTNIVILLSVLVSWSDCKWVLDKWSDCKWVLDRWALDRWDKWLEGW
jgi:hypothetical protein